MRVDLAQLNCIDGDGTRALRQLQRSGARISGASPHVALLLTRAAGEN